MVSVPSAFVLLVLALVGAMSPARTTVSLSRALAAWSPSAKEIRAQDATPDAAWSQAVRPESVRSARSIASQRDANAERRERTSGGDPAWVMLASMAAHDSRVASRAPCECDTGIRTPGLPAPSSRAPPLA
jgi:hypothetical protein